MTADLRTPLEYTEDHWKKVKTNTDHWKAWRPMDTNTLLEICMHRQRPLETTRLQHRYLETSRDY